MREELLHRIQNKNSQSIDEEKQQSKQLETIKDLQLDNENLKQLA